MKMATPKSATRSLICLIVSPDGAAGGGMGRVKDYLMQSGGDRDGRVVFRSLVTRDDRGLLISAILTLRAVAMIWVYRICGRLALVHVNFGDRASAVRKGLVTLLARMVGCTVVVHLHAVELDRQYRSAGRLLRYFIGLPFRVATTNIVLGEVWKRWMIDDIGVHPDNVDVVRNGVPMDEGPSRRVFANESPVSLLFLGNLIERKGVSDLLAALSALPASLPSWHLTLAGGGNIAHFREVAEHCGVAANATFLGWVDQSRARELLSSADLLVLPSYEEGLPLVILEALGHATPVLCTPVGAIPEVLKDGCTAAFCRPGDRLDLSDRLTELIASPALRQKLSDEGHAAFMARFSLHAYLVALFQVYGRRCGIEIVPADTVRKLS